MQLYKIPETKEIYLTDSEAESTESISLDLLRISLVIMCQVVFRIELHAQVITREGKNTLHHYKNHVNSFQGHVLNHITISY